jgi:hypothetical protein
MKVILIALSIIDSSIVFVFGGGLLVGLGMGGNTETSGKVVAYLAIITIILCIVIPWILLIFGGKAPPFAATITKWIAFILAVIPLVFAILWFVRLGTREKLPIRNPSEVAIDYKPGKQPRI